MKTKKARQHTLTLSFEQVDSLAEAGVHGGLIADGSVVAIQGIPFVIRFDENFALDRALAAVESSASETRERKRAERGE